MLNSSGRYDLRGSKRDIRSGQKRARNIGSLIISVTQHFYPITFHLKIVSTAPFNLNQIIHTLSSKLNLPNLNAPISSDSWGNSAGGCSNPSPGPGPDDPAETTLQSTDCIDGEMFNEMGIPLCRLNGSAPYTVRALFS